jgi:hypothetical protein
LPRGVVGTIGVGPSLGVRYERFPPEKRGPIKKLVISAGNYARQGIQMPASEALHPV